MKTLDREHVRSVVNTIFSQLLHTTPIDVIKSLGISKMYATQIVKNVNGENFTMAALVMQVNGFQFQGEVYIALDEGSDYYRIYGEKNGTTKEYHHDIAFDELGDVLDSMIETGGMTKEEYQAKVKDFVCSLEHQYLHQYFGAKFVLNTKKLSLYKWVYTNFVPIIGYNTTSCYKTLQVRHIFQCL